jgi:hypothetical protein
MSMVAAQNQEDLVGALFQALVNDGFTAHCCGPRDHPTAVICVYQWPGYLDVLTLRADGPAAAARLIKPADALNPPDGDDECVWAWVGEPDGAMWALLDLPHPDHADAPAEVIKTPAALRVPREEQRPTQIRCPDPGKAGARAARLSQKQEKTIMGEQFFNDLLDEVDAERATGFALNFTQDGTFQWGNFDPMVGRCAITQFTQSFFSKVTTVKHQLDKYWRVGEQHAMTEGRVTFTKLDGKEVTVPFATVAKFTTDGTKMIHYQVYLDPSPLLSGSTA